jgi:2,5-diketo-D-gluconate reductase B
MAKMVGPIPQMGFGTWKRFGDEAVMEVRQALEAGFRHIDTAEMYGNEEYVGKALAESGLARKDIFITTKVAPEHLGRGQVRKALETSLKKLRLDHVDLYLIHWPAVRDEYDINDYMAQLAAVQDAKLTTHIGVSNFTKRHIDAAMRVLGDKKIATNQVEIHPFFQNRVIVDYCKSKGIPMTAYSPVARGAVKDSPLLQQIAKRIGAAPGQVALAFLMAEGHIVIPTSTSPARMRENFRTQEIELTDHDLTSIRAMDEGRRLVTGGWAPVWDT